MIGHLRRAHEFQRLRQEGTRVRSGAVWCIMLPDPSYPAPSIAFALGRPVGTAVVRNRIRRQMRELMRAHEADFVPGLYLFGVSARGGDVPGFLDLRRAFHTLAARSR
ncbi:MAG: ribonuclease P protein component [Actinobacteria bacterium]|nr:ribonuclease P protein component [Actinomycetota bacterium]